MGKPSNPPVLAALRIVSLCILLDSCPRAFALNPALDVSQYAHTSWKTRDGFTKGAITSIAQTPDGYFWLGTEFGLLRFDGVRNIPFQEHLPGTYISGLLVTRDGRLWIGTGAGLASWKDGKVTRFPELADPGASPLLEDRDGVLWVFVYGAPNSKLCEIRNGATRCHIEDRNFARDVSTLHEDKSGNLWGGGLAGVWRLKPGPPKLYPMPDPELTVHALIEGDNGAILIALRSGMKQLIQGQVERKIEPYPLPGAGAVRQIDPRALLRDRGGSLWIGTDAGLLHIHQGRTDLFDRSDGLSGNIVGHLFEDREGNIWVSTYDGGLDRFRDVAVATMSFKEGLSNSSVLSVQPDVDGSIWIATVDGVNRWKDGQNTIYRKESVRGASGRASEIARQIVSPGLPDDDVESVFRDSRGRIWAFTLRGGAYLKDGRFVPLDGLPGRYIRGVTADAAGHVWVAHDRGLFHLAEERVVERIPWETLGHKGYADTLIPDSVQGGLWLGFFEGGVAYFKDGQVRKHYTAADGLGKGSVEDLLRDRDGTLWAATGGGLSRLKNDGFTTLARTNGLPCDQVHWVVEDGDRSFWVYMACGIAHITRSELEKWLNDSTRRIQMTVLDGTDGVTSRLFMGGPAPRVAKSTDGKLWFIHGAGLSFFDPHNLPVNKLPPPVHIEAVKINGKEASPADGVALSHTSNDLEIDYTALSLTIPERVKFRYKLEGKDTDWQDAGTRRQAYYGGLPPRHYRFRVMACNNDGVWNEAGAAWSFQILPAFYQTIWFQGLSVVAVAALISMLYRFRLRQATSRVNLLYTERLAERTRIARDLHDTLLQSLAGVSLQLDGIAKQTVTSPEKTQSMIGRVREQVDSAFREARVKVWNLRSPELELNGLPAALGQLAEEISTTAHVPCVFNASGQPRPCPPEVEEDLLRIAQEAAGNASRHADSNAIRIFLKFQAGSLTLSISDDGKGFDLEQGLAKSGHWGLKNIQERASQARGKCTIKTGAGQGTHIEVHVPLSAWSLRKILAKQAHSSSGRR